MTVILAPELRDDCAPDAPPVSRVEKRFTVNGSDALEQQLANICEKVSAGVRRIIPKHSLAGLALGGGYGRGEGGVLSTPTGDQPYNDLEFYIFVRGHPWLNERRYSKALHRLGAELESFAGVELEFKITSVEKLRRSPQSLFYHDLLVGHRWLLGDDSLFVGCEHHRNAGTIPLSEATRLLMNRCTGLLFAREKLEQACFSAEDADFVGRNIAKTELALGDAVLIAFGKYHWSCRERGRRLTELVSTQDLAWFEEVRQRHAAGIEFKLHPHRSEPSRASLQEHFAGISSLALKVWLWLENRRLGGDFKSVSDYVSSRINKWPGIGSWRNGLANARVFGLQTILLPRSRRHPRERILNALVLLLWAEACGPIANRVQRELLSSERTAIIPAYRKRWSRAS